MLRAFSLLFLFAACDQAPPPVETVARQEAALGGVDDRGNGATQNYATRLRCAAHLIDPRSRVYELSREISNTMPQSPFGDAPLTVDPVPTTGLPFTRHAGNGEIVCGGLGSQGTQMDAIGHVGFLDSPWLGSGPFPADQVHYFGGLTQADVKPTASSPLLRLGIEKAVPIVTSAVVLDAAKLRGRRLEPGELVTAADVRAMIDRAGLRARGILAGDVVFIHTGWGSLWQDPAPNPNFTEYYSQGPGLSTDAQQLLAQDRVVLMALDNPFTDPIKACQLNGTCAGPPDRPADMPIAVHHQNLAESGIHQIQNLNLDEVAADGVTLGCAMVLPLRIRGAAGSAVRPILVAAPR